MFRMEMFISGNGETGVPELNLASIPYMGSPEGLRHFLTGARPNHHGHRPRPPQANWSPQMTMHSVGVRVSALFLSSWNRCLVLSA
jgi:hypothetical protein